MPTFYITLICAYILISQTYAQLKCGGITYDRRNFTVAVMKRQYSTKTTGCINETKHDYIFDGEANMWTIEQNDPWLYFYVAERNKTKWYCTQLMKDFSAKCRIKHYYRTDRENVFVFDSKYTVKEQFPKTLDSNAVDYSKYFRTGWCENRDKMEAYFSKCLYGKKLEANETLRLETTNNITTNDVNSNNITAEVAAISVNVTTNPNGSAVNQHVTYKLLFWYFISLIPILLFV